LVQTTADTCLTSDFSGIFCGRVDIAIGGPTAAIITLVGIAAFEMRLALAAMGIGIWPTTGFPGLLGSVRP